MFRRRAGSPVRYVDLHSTNGSFVDNQRIEPGKPISLRDSNVIRIGPCQVTFYVRRASLTDDLMSIPVHKPPVARGS
jgi:pSer/pThr/pTyr-binding forkhead associated (FHA) protein